MTGFYAFLQLPKRITLKTVTIQPSLELYHDSWFCIFTVSKKTTLTECHFCIIILRNCMTGVSAFLQLPKRTTLAECHYLSRFKATAWQVYLHRCQIGQYLRTECHYLSQSKAGFLHFTAAKNENSQKMSP